MKNIVPISIKVKDNMYNGLLNISTNEVFLKFNSNLCKFKNIKIAVKHIINISTRTLFSF